MLFHLIPTVHVNEATLGHETDRVCARQIVWVLGEKKRLAFLHAVHFQSSPVGWEAAIHRRVMVFCGLAICHWNCGQTQKPMKMCVVITMTPFP